MNHRERVLASLDHRESDQVPIDLGRDGGNVLYAAINVQPDASPDRIEAMYQAALAHGS